MELALISSLYSKKSFPLLRVDKHFPQCPGFGIPFTLMLCGKHKVLHLIYVFYPVKPETKCLWLEVFPSGRDTRLGSIEEATNNRFFVEFSWDV